MHMSVNWLAVILATLSSCVVGMIWYSKGVFGKPWMKLAKLNEAKAKDHALVAIGVSVVMAFLTTLVLAHVTYLSSKVFTAHSFLYNALFVGFLLWLGFTAARIVTHDIYEQRPLALMMITVSFELVTITVMATIIGLLP